MKERFLFLKKEITRYRDMYEFLPMSYRKKLENYEMEYNKIINSLTEEELVWVDEKFGLWYEKYTMQETYTTMRLPEG
jgi:hypothetical protein